VIAVSLFLTACEASKPEVTFYGNRTAVNTGPTRWCEVDVGAQQVNCTETPADEVVRLEIGKGRPVQINVPGAIGGTPWAVYFRYLNRNGTLADGRSQIFADGQLAYTLEPFSDQDQLVYVEVQSGFVLTGGAQSGVDFAVTKSWLLLIDPPSADPQTPAG
jgi:hypothetical protein